MTEVFLSTENFLLIGSLLLFVGILAAKSGSKLGTPILLLFLFVGMLFGSDGLGIQFNSPSMAQFIGILALSIILFSGGMETKASEIKPVAAQGVTLATLGVFLTALLTGLFVYSIAGLFGINISLQESLLLAAVMSSTDSASVFSLLRSKKQGLKQNLRPLLELESGSNDPVAYILTIILITSITTGEVSIWESIGMFLMQMVVGAAAGFVLGKMAVKILNRINLDNKSLYSVLLLSLVFFIFSFTDLLKGNGYLAVYIAGLVVGNHKIVYKQSLTTFFDGFTWLFQIVMFISLGLLVNPHELIDVAGIALLICGFMIIFARPISVFLCLAPFRNITRKGKLYISWVGLRGAVPIIFATYPLVAGLEHANLIFNTVFFITIVSLLVQGTTVGYMAKLLGLSTDLEEDSFGIDMPDEIKASLTEMEVSAAFLARGNTLRDVDIPEDSLVMMVRRGEQYIVPKGDTEIMEGDKILLISASADAVMPDDYSTSRYARRARTKARLSRLNPAKWGKVRNVPPASEEELDESDMADSQEIIGMPEYAGGDPYDSNDEDATLYDEDYYAQDEEDEESDEDREEEPMDIDF